MANWLVSVEFSHTQLKILETCKKKRRLTCRDFSWWDLDDVYRKGALDKCVPNRGKNAGWAYFKLSRRGKAYLARLEKNRREMRKGRTV